MSAARSSGIVPGSSGSGGEPREELRQRLVALGGGGARQPGATAPGRAARAMSAARGSENRNAASQSREHERELVRLRLRVDDHERCRPRAASRRPPRTCRHGCRGRARRGRRARARRPGASARCGARGRSSSPYVSVPSSSTTAGLSGCAAAAAARRLVQRGVAAEPSVMPAPGHAPRARRPLGSDDHARRLQRLRRARGGRPAARAAA